MPAINGQEIHIENIPENCSVLIFSLTGQLLAEEKINADGSFLINGLSAGTYLLAAKRRDGTILFYRKFIVTE
jgi:hypothetical protein